MVALINDDNFKFYEGSSFEAGMAEAHISYNDIIILMSIYRRWKTFTSDYDKHVEAKKKTKKEGLRARTRKTITDKDSLALFDGLEEQDQDD